MHNVIDVQYTSLVLIGFPSFQCNIEAWEWAQLGQA